MYVSYMNLNGFSTAIRTDLKTAKHLKQIAADQYRSSQHLRQKPLNWVRHHSDRTVYWVGTIDGKIYVSMTKN